MADLEVARAARLAAVAKRCYIAEERVANAVMIVTVDTCKERRCLLLDMEVVCAAAVPLVLPYAVGR